MKLRDGFTIVEMLIVISVMMIISAMLLGSARSNQTQIVLYTSQATVVGVLNKAKSLALAKWDPNKNPALSACGFGVHFDVRNNLFILYQDSPTVSVACDNMGHDYGYVSGEDKEIQIITLDSRIEFAGSPADIVFIAPYLKTNLNTKETITLKVKDGIQTARAEVTPGGGITSL